MRLKYEGRGSKNVSITDLKLYQPIKRTIWNMLLAFYQVLYEWPLSILCVKSSTSFLFIRLSDYLTLVSDLHLLKGRTSLSWGIKVHQHKAKTAADKRELFWLTIRFVQHLPLDIGQPGAWLEHKTIRCKVCLSSHQIDKMCLQSSNSIVMKILKK